VSARVLIVDDVPANLRLLEAKLSAEYYDVISAARGEEAMRAARRDKPDIVLLDVMMPGVDGFEVCRRLKDDPETRDIPVILITALDRREHRLKGLEAGAEDFLTKPIDDVQLLARVRNLVRLKMATDELRSREAMGAKLGVIDSGRRAQILAARAAAPATILVVDDNARQAADIIAMLRSDRAVRFDQASASELGAPDMLIVSLFSRGFDGFRIIGKMRSVEATRHLPILAVVDPDDRDRSIRALDLGAHDVIQRPVDEDELNARVRSLVKRKRTMEALRTVIDQSIELAVTDQLTGLFNRRFLFSQLTALMRRAAHGGAPVSVLMLDIDHFKKINDAYGHDAGDDVLREFAARMASNVRPVDFACRMGGEEFAIVMPGASGDAACLAGERIRRQVAAAPFILSRQREGLDVTVSIGVAALDPRDEDAEALIKRADEALYEAKRSGRNRVVGRSLAARAV
jgi:two-component system cell cycle response regulator